MQWLTKTQRLAKRYLLMLSVTIAVVAFAPEAAHADGGSGGCDVLRNPTCTVGTGGGGGSGPGGGGSGSVTPSDPCAAYPDAAYGDEPPVVSQACADELQGRYCRAADADALGGLGLTSWAAVPPATMTLLNQQFTAEGCPAIVTAASLAQEAFSTIVFPRPSGHRSPSESRTFQGYPTTWVNLWTFFWTDPSTWRTLSASASAAGLTATVTATPVALNFDPGDGDTVASCAGPGRAWRDSDGNAPPSDRACGYQYTHVTTSPVTATETIVWQITWTGTGNTGGEIPGLSTSTSGQLNVLQIQAVVR
ncbi:hypothetical protein SAMN05892883_2262 [Jatrophihabitans sp. GAS493]|nr:hypothetical protein SAMN05892883_2262 [Jatrophihabitans sp. GAS493]